MNAIAGAARLHLMKPQPHRAVTLTEQKWPRLPSAGMYGDFLAVRALALACTDQTEAAHEVAQQALNATHQIEGRVMALFARAVADVKNGGDRPELVTGAVEATRTTGNLDAFVLA